MQQQQTQQNSSKITEKDYIKECVDIVEVAKLYLPIKRNGRSFFACCPFHSERTPSFSIQSQEQYYHCFGCGESGDVFSLVMYMEDCTFPEAMKSLKERFGIDTNKKNVQKMKRRNYMPILSYKSNEEQLNLISSDLKLSLDLNKKHFHHLQKDRGMTPDEIRIRGYRSFPDKPWTPFKKMENRDYTGFPGMYKKTGQNGQDYWLLNSMGEGILIPFHNERNYVVGWQIRLDNPPPAYYCKTNYPENFRIHESGDGVVKVLWDGEIINELKLTVGVSKTFNVEVSGRTVEIGEVGLKRGQKYFWLSSVDKKNGTGAGNPLPVHIAVPVRLRETFPTGRPLGTKELWITEGPIKAEIASEKLNKVFLSVPGVSSWRRVLDLIGKMKVEKVVLAFDMDMSGNLALREQVKELKVELRKLRQIKECYLALWNDKEHGKGIDNMILAGFRPKTKILFDNERWCPATLKSINLH